MTPEEFDEVYYALAVGLREERDADLFRDRLILSVLEGMDADTALACISRARLGCEAALDSELGEHHS